MEESKALEIMESLKIKRLTKKGKIKDISGIMMEFRMKSNPKPDNQLCKDFYETMCGILGVGKNQ